MAAGTLTTDDVPSKYPSTRKEALATGARFFMLVEPCIRGHNSKRVASSGQCAECIKVLRRTNEYYKNYGRQWRVDNRERLAEMATIRSKREKVNFPWKSLLKEAKSRAKKFGKSYSLSETWAEARWTGKCELSGLPFASEDGSRTGTPFSPSIDRINPSKGYVPDNCRFVLLAINRLKGILDDAQTLRIATALVTSSWAAQQRQLPASDRDESLLQAP